MLAAVEGLDEYVAVLTAPTTLPVRRRLRSKTSAASWRP
jgi:hypothetical protein